MMDIQATQQAEYDRTYDQYWHDLMLIASDWGLNGDPMRSRTPFPLDWYQIHVDEYGQQRIDLEVSPRALKQATTGRDEIVVPGQYSKSWKTLAVKRFLRYIRDKDECATEPLWLSDWFAVPRHSNLNHRSTDFQSNRPETSKVTTGNIDDDCGNPYLTGNRVEQCDRWLSRLFYQHAGAQVSEKMAAEFIDRVNQLRWCQARRYTEYAFLNGYNSPSGNSLPPGEVRFSWRFERFELTPTFEYYQSRMRPKANLGLDETAPTSISTRHATNFIFDENVNCNLSCEYDFTGIGDIDLADRLIWRTLPILRYL